MILIGESGNTQSKTCSSSTMSTTTIMWTDQGLNLDMYGERLLTNCWAAAQLQQMRAVIVGGRIHMAVRYFESIYGILFELHIRWGLHYN